MKARALTLIMVAVIFGAAVSTGYSQTFTAKGLVEIKNISSSSVLFDSPNVINTLLQTTCSEYLSKRKDMKELANTEIDFNLGLDLEGKAKVPGQDLYNYLFILEVVVEKGGTPAIAMKLRDATVEWLERFVIERISDLIREIENRLGQAQRNVAEAEYKLKHLQDEQQALIGTGGQGVLSRSQVQDKINSLQKEKQQAELELRGTQARTQALHEQIAKVAAEIEEKIANDPILAEMQKVLDISEKRLERAQKLFENKTVTEQEIYDSQQAVIRAKIDIVSRREAIGRSVNNDSLAKWNGELANIAIRRAEQEVYLSHTAVQLAEIEGKNLLELAGRIEQLGMEIDQARASLYEANREVERIRREMQSIREPRVVLLGNN